VDRHLMRYGALAPFWQQAILAHRHRPTCLPCKRTWDARELAGPNATRDKLMEVARCPAFVFSEQ
jgi:hypothetical protein